MINPASLNYINTISGKIIIKDFIIDAILRIDDSIFGLNEKNKVNNQIISSPVNSNIILYSNKKIVTAIKKDLDIKESANKKNQTLFLYGGKGGEGTVFISTDSKLAIKIYNKNNTDNQKEKKLKSMVDANINVQGICWPIQYFTLQNRIGYIMRAAQGKDLHLLLRKKTLEQYDHIDRAFLTKISIDILDKIIFLHKNNILIGDINLMNIWVDTEKGESYFIDTDSFQFEKYACPVGSITFTPPELQGKNFSTLLRKKDHEYFSIATLLFMIFHGGKAPYSYLGGTDPAKNIRDKNFPYPFGSDFHYETPKGAYENMWTMLSMEMKEAFYNVFKKGERKSPEEWKENLLEYDSRLQNDLKKNIFPTSYKTVGGRGSIGRGSIKGEGETDGIGSPENIINHDGNGFAILELSSKAVKLLVNKKRKKVFDFHSFFKKTFFTNTGNLLLKTQNMRMHAYCEKVIPRINELKQDAVNKGSKYLYVYAGSVYRAAKNREKLLEMIKDLTDLNVKIINNEDENYYSYLAQINTIPELRSENICMFDFGAGGFRINLFDKNRKNIWREKSDLGSESLKKVFLFNNDSDANTLNAFQSFDRLILKEKEIKSILNNCKKINNVPFQFVGLGGPFKTLVDPTGRLWSSKIHKEIFESNQFENKKNEVEEKINSLAHKVGQLVERRKNFKEWRVLEDLFSIRISLPLIQKIFETTGKKDFMLSGTGLWYGLYYHHLENNKDDASSSLSCGVF